MKNLNNSPIQRNNNVQDSQDIVFQNVTTTITNGQTLNVGSFKTLTVEIFGSATSGTVNFMGAHTSGIYTPIPGTKVNGDTNYTQATNTTSISTTPSIWQFDVTGLKTVQMQISAISGGNITVQGTVVA